MREWQNPPYYISNFTVSQDTPQALALRREPKANVERYDSLRSQTEGDRHASSCRAVGH